LSVDASPPMVRVSQVSRRFGDTRAVDDVSFELPAGAFLTILGASGSGKTTLLRIIAGFLKPDHGEITIKGESLSAVPVYRRSIGMVFQRLALFPHMSAADNVAYPLKMRHFPPAGIPERVEKYLDLVRLQGLGDRRPHELSGGQQQRVAIARALVFEPDLLLLDEPLAALDRKLREEMQLEFRRIQRELGVTTINVTHDQREALVMSDQIMVMEQGAMQQLAPPMATYREPANRYVAGFIGVTNFLSGEIVEAGEGTARVRVAGFTLSGRCLEPGARGAADCALRAEQVRVAGADEPDLLLLDEPLAALDRKLREEMQLEFRRIQRELGVTTINVTHDQREALVMSDQIMVMEQGAMQQLAPPMATYREPANRYVAGFIGVTNFLAGEIVETGEGMARVRVAGFTLGGRCLEPEARGPADCALRAEQVRVAGLDESLDDLSVRLKGEVQEAIFEGDRLVYSIRCPGLEDTLIRAFDHDPLHHRAFQPGETVQLGWNNRDLLIYPR